MNAKIFLPGYGIAAMLLSVLFGPACATDDVEMRLLVYDKQIDSYAMENVSVATLADVDKLAGEATVLKGGLSLILDYEKGTLDWEDEGGSVAFTAVTSGDVLVPDSFDSLAMASIYYHMELSYLFFKDELGMDADVLKRLPTYYKPEIVIKERGEAPYTMTDNAFYMKISDNERGFFVVPFEMFQWIPIALNTGIITHEYTHYVFDRLLQDSLPPLDAKSENFLRAFNEATADFMATVRTEDPDFMAPSIPAGLFVTPECNGLKDMELTRDISDPITQNYNQIMDYWARKIEASNAYCPYELGLMLAGVFYEIAGALDTESGESRDTPSRQSMLRVASALLNALPGLSQTVRNSGDFELWEMFSELAAQFEIADERDAACEIIEKRYAVYFDEVVGC